jgi:hypothetical protein
MGVDIQNLLGQEVLQFLLPDFFVVIRYFKQCHDISPFRVLVFFRAEGLAPVVQRL